MFFESLPREFRVSVWHAQLRICAVVVLFIFLVSHLAFAAPARLVAHSAQAVTGEDVDVAIPLKVDGGTALLYEAVFTKDLKGAVIVDAATGAASFKPTKDFNGVTSFTFRACDPAHSCSQSAVVRIRVNPANDAPAAFPVSIMTTANAPVMITFKGADVDGDRLSYQMRAPRAGTLGTVDTAGRVVYTPPDGFIGADKFLYAVSDGKTLSTAVYVSIDVVPARLGLTDVVVAAAASPDRIKPVLDELAFLGVPAAAISGAADLTWASVEPRRGEWDFAAADAVFKRGGFEPVVTLFAKDFASPTPPWVTSGARFQKFMNDDAYDYVRAVVGRYKNQVRYWIIGGGMESWAAADPVAEFKSRIKLPENAPPGGYAVADQAVFLRDAARAVREADPDAVIILPPLSGLGERSLTWLGTVVAATANVWFDVVSYRFTGRWESYERARERLSGFLIHNNMIEKKSWLVGTGTSSDAANVKATNYPNSPQVQAADVFRRLTMAYAGGDAMVLWEMYRDPHAGDSDATARSGFGLKDAAGMPKPAYHVLRLFAHELVPFSKITRVPYAGPPSAGDVIVSNSLGETSQNAIPIGTDPAIHDYRIDASDGSVKHVVWGAGSYGVPDGMTQMAFVIADAKGNVAWRPVKPGDDIVIVDGDAPLLLK